jgi:hypothetical protein
VDLGSTIGLPLGYVDPSTGGQLFQLLAIAFTAISGSLLFFSRQIRSGLARLKRLLNDRSSRR